MNGFPRNRPGPLQLPGGAVAAGDTGEFQDFIVPKAGVTALTFRWTTDQPGTLSVYRRIPGETIDETGTTGFTLAFPAVVMAAASTEDELDKLDVPVRVNDHFRVIWETDGGAGGDATPVVEVLYARVDG